MAQKYKKDSRGYYHARVWDGTYVNGKKHYKSIFSKKSSKDLEQKVAELTAQVKGREYVVPTEQSFQEYARHWESVYKCNKSANTRAMYQNIIEKHFDGLTFPISELNRVHYAKMMNSIEGKRTRQQAAMVFKQVLKSAIHDKLLPAIALDEVLEGYELPKYKSEEKRPLTDAEKKALKRVELNARDKAFLYILYGCGLRRGECASLTRSDVNLDDLTINVDKAYAYVGQDVILKDTKNTKHRVVPIPESIVPALKEYIDDLKTSELFAMASGARLTKSSLDKMWRRILKQLQKACTEPIEGLTPHILRHNYCTSLCYQIPAISINDIAYLMGDSKQVVLNVYNHLNMDKQKVASTVSKTLNL